MEKYNVKAKQYGSSQESETNEIWNKTIFKRSNIVLVRYLRQMEHNEDVTL